MLPCASCARAGHGKIGKHAKSLPGHAVDSPAPDMQGLADAHVRGSDPAGLAEQSLRSQTRAAPQLRPQGPDDKHGLWEFVPEQAPPLTAADGLEGLLRHAESGPDPSSSSRVSSRAVKLCAGLDATAAQSY